MKSTRLPAHLEQARQEIEQIAREYGLDFFPIIYEVLDYRTLYEVAAFGGFPTRYPHWRFGMEYDQLLKGHVWTGSTIYEMVINNNPAYAYLLEGNEDVTQKMVMAHVTGHVDFFKNNMWFAHTNRKMLDTMANHAARIQRIIDRIGYDQVEDFIDTCLSLENLIDYHAPYIRRSEAVTPRPIVSDEEPPVVEGLPVEREYMRDYINPPEFLEAQRRKLEEERARQRRFPENPQRDVLLFLMNFAPLENWQHTVLEIIRDEAYYFAPQGMTKILNEGWACLHGDSLIPTDRGIIPLRELVSRRYRSQVSDGERQQTVYDWNCFTAYPTVTIHTRAGFTLTGSFNHRVMLASGEWRRLDALRVGDQVRIAGGTELWATQPARLRRRMPLPQVLATVSATTSPSLPSRRHRYHSAPTEVVDEAMATAIGQRCVTHPDHRALDAIRRSPRPQVVAFLRAFIAGAVDTSQELTIPCVSIELAQTVQLLLANLGVLARRIETTLQIDDPTALKRAYTTPSPTVTWTDEIVAIERGRADVYDISVTETHRYAAQGFINHNSYWHSTIMTQRVASAAEIISFADLHSGVVATSGGRLNPYKLGLELLRDIEDRWNKGKFGKEYEECDDIALKRSWDKQLGLGRQKIFEVRRLYNDVTFIDEFLTPEFVMEQKLFTFRYNRDTDLYEIASREFKEVKEKLLFRLTNFGQPVIFVEDGNYGNRGELYLRHRHEGVDLKMDYARETMRNLYKIWTRPVHLETVIEEKRRLLSFDGRDFSERRID
ncbi:SpoVR family protein [Chloroflexus sp. MS-CIW-1]|uniref:SpoVR family protein n=1 Tax=Chloroflexus sp. MS-CIW-1 TaxID=3055768 RepID=UPI002649350A|nr:SpoVR family protein [Chloroflexus sp. MS-CIW-1]MDN5273641.1 SpoVR family protein [Chloroflexus sp. MS-CIW-1]